MVSGDRPRSTRSSTRNASIASGIEARVSDSRPLMRDHRQRPVRGGNTYISADRPQDHRRVIAPPAGAPRPPPAPRHRHPRRRASPPARVVRSSGREQRGFGRRSAADHPLADHDVRVGVRRHLREVRHAQHLVVAAQRAQPLAQGRRVPAADPGIDLVEDEERRLVGRGQHDLQRQRQPARLAARRDSRRAAAVARRRSART